MLFLSRRRRCHHPDPDESWREDVQAVRRWLFTHPSGAWLGMDDGDRTELARNLIRVAQTANEGVEDDR